MGSPWLRQGSRRNWPRRGPFWVNYDLLCSGGFRLVGKVNPIGERYTAGAMGVRGCSMLLDSKGTLTPYM